MEILIVLLVIFGVVIGIKELIAEEIYFAVFGGIQHLFWGLLWLISFGHIKNPHKKDKEKDDEDKKD